ncbi:hypothetical protein SKAU_G00296480 [Synaphobranchus kaupii]|uniref:Uncharacterized protein n=1 Tax=Synaphobranchus kaupii TaxID=118154 RepID=A0A9Q1EUX5_SYNKA|nr:hypothetical protein SKAU_G00296480 [Synaphobranchus kaupii]
MGMLKFWTICAVFIFLDHSFSLQCKWTQYKLRKLNEKSIQLLTDMGGSFPHKCLKENVKLMFPDGAYDITRESQNDDIASVAYGALRDLVKIFNNDLTSTSWDTEKLGFFKNILSRQIENLEQCVGGEMTFSGDGSLPSDDNGRLKSYVESLNTLLKEKGQSACAWEVVRKEVLHSLGEAPRVSWKKKTGDFPQQCINENVLITFPRSAFASNGSSDSDSVRTAINQTLHSINYLFQNNDLPTDWDEIKLIEDFQAIVYRQVGKSKCNSFCGWEIVRRELVYTLQFIIKHCSDSLRWPKTI